MAEDAFRHVLKDVLEIDPDVHVMYREFLHALEQNGVTDIYDLVFLGSESLENLTFCDPGGTNKEIKVKLGPRNRVRDFQSYIAHLEAIGQQMVDVDWFKMSSAQFNSYRSYLHSELYGLYTNNRCGPDRSTYRRYSSNSKLLPQLLATNICENHHASCDLNGDDETVIFTLCESAENTPSLFTTNNFVASDTSDEPIDKKVIIVADSTVELQSPSLSSEFSCDMPNRPIATFDGEISAPIKILANSDWVDFVRSEVRKCSVLVPQYLHNMCFRYDGLMDPIFVMSNNCSNDGLLVPNVDSNKCKSTDNCIWNIDASVDDKTQGSLIVCKFQGLESDFVITRENGEIKVRPLTVNRANIGIPWTLDDDTLTHTEFLCNIGSAMDGFREPDKFVIGLFEIQNAPVKQTNFSEKFVLGANKSDPHYLSSGTVYCAQLAVDSTLTCHVNSLTRQLAYESKLRSFCTTPRYKEQNTVSFAATNTRETPDSFLTYLRGIPVRGKDQVLHSLIQKPIRKCPGPTSVRHLGRIIDDQMIGFSYKDWEDCCFPSVDFLLCPTAC